MAESFAFNIAENVLGKLTSLALQQVVSAWGLESDLENIKKKLLAIKAVLLDAEHKQMHDERIQIWLKELQEVLYDAEDVLDEVECEALHRQVVKSAGSTRRKVGSFFSSSNPIAFRFKIANEVKKIRDRMTEIAALKSDFGLTEGVNDGQVIRREREMTHSFVDAATVIGRDEDKEKIINQLLKGVADGTENVSVLPIVGMGGLGKTTLAKLVFNDERVATHFEKQVWVCISEDFDLQKVLAKIIKIATGERCSDWEVEQLQKLLRDTLKDKKYLLVLDDVWNEDPRKWDELKALLIGGANGSWIVVTTRGNKVASVMCSVPTYDLNSLSNEYCSSLFFKCAFKDKQHLEHYPNLVTIGEEIVSRCKGVPLAVVTLGNMLFSTTNEREWKSVRDSDLWQLKETESGILPALRISYEHLPSYLKRCFAYCSFFPKDHRFVDIELIQFWMAHGLLKQNNDKEELEDIGLAYLKELYARSFFQDLEDHYVIGITRKMHDLIHDLAISLTQNECSVITATKQISNNGRRRHLLFADPASLPNDLPSILRGTDHVRSISPYTEERGFTSQSIIDMHLSRFQCLRWLNLSRCESEMLPEDIGKLKHLRFLNLIYSKIKRLPKSIYKLQSLQSLWLWGCEELEELHTDIRFLINLRSLFISTKQKCFSQNGIGRLTSLRSLGIISCENIEYLFEDMQGLSNLRTLFIMECESLISLPESMKYLPALENLIIGGCENLDLKMEEEDGKDLSRLGLKNLRLLGLPKLVELPQWLLQNTLQLLVLGGCPNLQRLPACLKNLSSLQQLIINDCGELSQRCRRETGEDWSNIAHIPNIFIDGSKRSWIDDQYTLATQIGSRLETVSRKNRTYCDRDNLYV